jgi:hypothetical protein
MVFPGWGNILLHHYLGLSLNLCDLCPDLIRINEDLLYTHQVHKADDIMKDIQTFKLFKLLVRERNAATYKGK